MYFPLPFTQCDLEQELPITKMPIESQGFILNGNQLTIQQVRIVYVVTYK